MFEKRIRAIAFLVAVLVLFSACVVACDSKNNTNSKRTPKTENKEKNTGETPSEELNESDDTQQAEKDETPDEVEELDDSMFNIYHGGKYLCCFVWSDNPTSAEKSVAKELKTLLGDKTGKQVTFVTPDKVTEEHKFLVLLGNTGYKESKDLSKKLGEREALIDIVDNKLVIAFSNQASGAGVVKKLVGKLTNKQTARLAFSYTAKYKAPPEIDALPVYTGGTVQTVDCGQNTEMKVIKGSNAQALASYAQSLEDAEFVKVSNRTAEGNIFYTYRSDNHYIYMYYTKYSGQIRIITGPIESWCEEDYSSKLPKTYTPYLASIQQEEDAQGYIFRLDDGRFIVQDGGLIGSDRVYAALKKLEPQKDIVIAAWFISHPHPDHYPALMEFAKNHGHDKDIKVERIIHNYAHEDMYNVVGGTAGDDNCSKDVVDFYNNLNLYMSHVPVIKAHTGQVISFGSTSIEVLYTVEDMVPGNIENVNATSFVFRATVAGQSVMMLADTYTTSANILCNMWGNYLKSDVVQIAHHGCWPATADLYHKIQGKLIIIPTLVGGYRVYLDDSRWENVTNAYLKYATDISVSLDKMVIIELPYAFKNDINQRLAEIRNS